MQHVFGPVPSRRLGQSLGIDPVVPKTCNWNCVYCQLGRSVPLMAERREYVPAEAVIAELAERLAHYQGRIDWVTFVGSGETTLHSRLGWMIRRVKAMTEIPVAVITNGSLLYLPEVRAELATADAVLPTLDAGTPDLYRRLNRPWPEPDFGTYVQGLVDFRAMYRGRYWLEVMLIRGLNDTEEALRALAAQIARIRPDKVHLTLPERPPAEPWVQPPDAEGLMRAEAILRQVAEVVHPARGAFDFSGYDDPQAAVLAVLARHHMRESELKAALARWGDDAVQETLQALQASGQVQVLERYGTRFWSLAQARYA